jgi:hypothetical protein
MLGELSAPNEGISVWSSVSQGGYGINRTEVSSGMGEPGRGQRRYYSCGRLVFYHAIYLLIEH